MNEDDALKTLSAITHPLRLRALRRLVQAAPEGLSAGDIAIAIEASPSKTSFHLNMLSEAGLVRSERQSRHIRYRVEFAALGGVLRYLIEDCCGGHPVVRDCCGASRPRKAT